MKSQETTTISMKYRILIVLLSLFGTGIILFATYNYGAGITPDSVGYIATARHIADGMGFITYNNAPLIVQPPLYPIILGAVDFVLRIDPLLSANVVSAILFGLSLYLSGVLFFKHLTLSPIFALLGTASLLTSIPLVIVFFMAWSEPLFIFFLILYLIAILIYSEKKNIKTLLLLSLSVALACLTRYIGVILVLTGIISIFLIQKDNVKNKFSHTFIFTFASVLPIGIWVGRNFFLSETLFGPRYPSLHTLFDNIRYTFDTIVSWYLPSRITDSRPILMLLSLIIGFLVCMIFVWAKTPITALLKQTRPLIVFILLVIIGYIGFLIISSTTTNYDSINYRLLSPIVVPITLILFSAIEILFKLIKQRFTSKPVESIFVAGIILWLIFPAKVTVLNVINQFNEGTGFSAYYWEDSHTIQYIRDHNLSNCTIYSNGADVTYLLLNINVKPIPSKSSGANVIADLSSLNNSFPQENKACLVWFNHITRKYLFTPDELISITNLEQVIQLDDGTIYVVSKK
ncbi:MAG: glycosyltransferase family 39 protein [Anaerolineaceae bacterium]|nr:glycosyltransferase family 39 protein [Anaerolineaceae bacterium]